MASYQDVNITSRHNCLLILPFVLEGEGEPPAGVGVVPGAGPAEGPQLQVDSLNVTVIGPRQYFQL